MEKRRTIGKPIIIKGEEWFIDYEEFWFNRWFEGHKLVGGKMTFEEWKEIAEK